MRILNFLVIPHRELRVYLPYSIQHHSNHNQNRRTANGKCLDISEILAYYRQDRHKPQEQRPHKSYSIDDFFKIFCSIPSRPDARHEAAVFLQILRYALGIKYDSSIEVSKEKYHYKIKDFVKWLVIEEILYPYRSPG